METDGTAVSDPAAYSEAYNLYLDQLSSAALNLNQCMISCVIHLLFPINTILEKFFLAKTNRKPSEIDVNFLNEVLLFVVTIVWFNDYTRFTGLYNPELEYADPSMTDG